MKNKFILFSLIGAAILLSIFMLSKDTPRNSEALRFGYVGHSMNYSPVMVAIENDLFQKQGQSAEPKVFKSGSEARLALATGELDIAFLSISETLIAIEAGAPMKMIAPITGASTVIFVRPDGAKSFKDLVGEKVVGDAGTSRLEFIRAAKKEGFNSSDFEFIGMDNDYREAALMKIKNVEAVPTSRYRMKSFTAAGAVPMKEWEEKGYGKVFNPHTYLVANSNYLKENPLEVEKMVNAIADAQKLILQDPEKAAPQVALHIEKVTNGAAKYSAKDIVDTWKDSLRPMIWGDLEEVSQIIQFMHEARELKGLISIEQVFDLYLQAKLVDIQNSL